MMPIVAWLLACAGGAATGGELTEVDVAALQAAMDDGAKVVDVRTEAEYAGGHVPGAIHLPLQSFDPSQLPLFDIDKDHKVYFICERGGRSATASQQAADAGYHAVNVAGGTSAWRQAGYPLAQ